MRKYIPNTLTCLNLACGFYAAAFGFAGDYLTAALAILAAAVFDFADGFAARLLHSFSPLGKDLDSLADIVSFGVAPAAMLYSLLCYSGDERLAVCAFAIPVLSALRLAKFNIDTRQTHYFRGLPVPAHAILWAAAIVACTSNLNGALPLSPTLYTVPAVVLAIAALLTSLLLVSDLPMFSLKLASLRWKDAKNVYILGVLALALTALFGAAGIAAAVVTYILMSLIIWLLRRHHQRRQGKQYSTETQN
jgi:CDP-diacylglycerol--serine O-phosphatidyltransferase